MLELIQRDFRISGSASVQGDIQDGQVATGTVKATLWGELPSAKPSSSTPVERDLRKPARRQSDILM